VKMPEGTAPSLVIPLETLLIALGQPCVCFSRTAIPIPSDRDSGVDWCARFTSNPHVVENRGLFGTDLFLKVRSKPSETFGESVRTVFHSNFSEFRGLEGLLETIASD
jgi:hypothetical protein